MAAPTVTFPTTGSDPRNINKAGAEAAINAALSDNYDLAVVASAGLDFSVGGWDASAGTFPTNADAINAAGGHAAYVVTVAGTVDSISYAVGDVNIALVDAPSTTTYAGNWVKQSKETPALLDVKAAFGATGDGTTDDSAAFQAANDTGSNLRFFVPSGTYLLSSVVNITNDNLTFYGPGTIKEGVLRENTIYVTGDDVVFDGLTFTGPEDLTSWNALSAVDRQAFKQFIEFDTCTGGQVRNCKSSGKRSLVKADTCTKLHVLNNRHDGFFGTIAASSPADTNWAATINVQAGSDNHIKGNEANHAGSVVLIAMDSSDNVIEGTTGRELHDNALYNSSGDRSVFQGGVFKNVNGAGAKIRGRGHHVGGMVLTNAGTASPAISLTGNGLTPDAYNSNGYGTVCTGNVIIDCPGVAIDVNSQDGYYPRDFIVSNNTIENHTGTGTNAAMLINCERGAKVTGNIIRGSTASYAIGVFGPGAGNRAFDVTVTGNTISNVVQGIRGQNVDNSMFLDNHVNGNSAEGIELRLCEGNLLLGNWCLTNGIKLSATVGEECYTNRAIGNVSSGYVGYADNTIAPIEEIRESTWTPTLTTNGTDFDSVSYTTQQGYYKKHGSLVVATFVITTSSVTIGSASGSAVIGGLPFTVSNSGAGSYFSAAVTNCSGFAGDMPQSAMPFRNTKLAFLYYRTASNGADSALVPADVGTGSNALTVTLVYLTDE